MRFAIPAMLLAAIGLLLAVTLFDSEIPLPPVAPDVEPICREAMERSAADLSWVAPDRDAQLRGRDIRTVTFGELPAHHGKLVRVAAVLHAEFGWVSLYPSRRALEESWGGPWVTFDSLWPGERYSSTKGPSISDRCVVVEGTYHAGPGGHFGMFDGTIRDVLRLDVWSTPHRPWIAPADSLVRRSPTR